MNLIDLQDQNFNKFGEYSYLVHENREYTNLEILNFSNKLAQGLLNLGIVQKDRVVVMLMNCPEILVSYQGILRAGGTIVPVIPKIGSIELKHILNNSEAEAIITSRTLLDKVKEAQGENDYPKNVIIVEDENDDGVINFWSLVNSSNQAVPAHVGEDDLAVILYTAGTTGTPKGVMLSHKNLYSVAVNRAKVFEIKPSNVVLSALPLTHSYGLSLMNMLYIFGNKAILMRWWDTEEAFRLIEKYRATEIAGVPTMYTMILNSPLSKKYDLSSLERCFSGSAPLPVEVTESFEKKFNCPIFEGYGLTEASPSISLQHAGSRRKVGSVGQLIPGIEARIVNALNEDVPLGEPGELLVRGPNISQGYYKLPDETEKCFKNGWLHTGDSVKMDKDGYLYILERLKNLIIRGGFNVYPGDTEEVLYAHPAIEDAAVVGVPDPLMGEEIKAYIVLKTGFQLAPEEIINHCQSLLAKYKCPKHIEFIDKMPRNAMGKILKKKLRELHKGK